MEERPRSGQPPKVTVALEAKITSLACNEAPAAAHALGVGVSSVYRYAQTYQLQGLSGYLRAEEPGYWGLLTSAQLAGLCRELGQQLYTDCRALADWLAATYGMHYSVSGLTDVLHWLGFSYKRTTAMLEWSGVNGHRAEAG